MITVNKYTTMVNVSQQKKVVLRRHQDKLALLIDRSSKKHTAENQSRNGKGCR